MNPRNKSVTVGVFDDRAAADRAVTHLLGAGFGRDEIGVALRYDSAAGPADADAGADTQAGEGAVAGMLAGLGLGALTGVGVVSGMIPVIGPAIAAGTLGVILSNAAAGAGVAGVLGALVGAGMSDDEAQFYQSEFESGRVIVTVASGPRSADAAAILAKHGAYDTTSRPAEQQGGSRPSMSMQMRK